MTLPASDDWHFLQQSCDVVCCGIESQAVVGPGHSLSLCELVSRSDQEEWRAKLEFASQLPCQHLRQY